MRHIDRVGKRSENCHRFSIGISFTCCHSIPKSKDFMCSKSLLKCWMIWLICNLCANKAHAFTARCFCHLTSGFSLNQCNNVWLSTRNRWKRKSSASSTGELDSRSLFSLNSPLSSSCTKVQLECNHWLSRRGFEMGPINLRAFIARRTKVIDGAFFSLSQPSIKLQTAVNWSCRERKNNNKKSCIHTRKKYPLIHFQAWKRIAIEIEWNEHSRIENYNFQLLEAASIECGGLGGWEVNGIEWKLTTRFRAMQQQLKSRKKEIKNQLKKFCVCTAHRRQRRDAGGGIFAQIER